MGKEKFYKLYILLRRNPLDSMELKNILGEENKNKLLENVLLSITYLQKDSKQSKFIDTYIYNLKRTIMELIEEEDLNFEIALNDLNRISFQIFQKKAKYKSVYSHFVEQIKNILITKQVREEQTDQYTFLYSIIFDVQEISYLEYILNTYPHYVNTKNKEGISIFVTLLDKFIKTKENLYFNSVMNVFLFHSRFHLEDGENALCMRKLKDCINKKDEKMNDYIQILDLLLKKEFTKEHIFNINKKYDIKVGFETSVTNEIKQERDYIITIDSPQTLDIDDALSIRKKEDCYVLNIYITNVAQFIKPNSYLDKEAFRRTESLYLSDKVISMLPTELSNDQFSLNKNSYKNIYVYTIKVYNDGSIGEFSVKKNVILVDRKTTYQEVNIALKEGREDSFGKTCIYLSEIAYLLKQKNPDKTLYRVIEDIQNKGIYNTKNTYSKRTSAEIIIEEAMLLVNYLSAKMFYEKGYPYIYRNHLKPNCKVENSKISELEQTIKQDYKNKQEYIKILENLSKIYPKPFYSPNNEGHYGLGLDYYSHCTSPIRRYMDIVAQRLLEEYFFTVQTTKRDRYWEKTIEQICLYGNARVETNLLYEKEYEKMKTLIRK